MGCLLQLILSPFIFLIPHLIQMLLNIETNYNLTITTGAILVVVFIIISNKNFKKVQERASKKNKNQFFTIRNSVISNEEDMLREIRKNVNKGTVEDVAIQIAKASGGNVTAGEVALKSDHSKEEATKKLEKLVSKGICQLRVKPSGARIYWFPDFAKNEGVKEAEYRVGKNTTDKKESYNNKSDSKINLLKRYYPDWVEEEIKVLNSLPLIFNEDFHPPFPVETIKDWIDWFGKLRDEIKQYYRDDITSLVYYSTKPCNSDGILTTVLMWQLSMLGEGEYKDYIKRVYEIISKWNNNLDERIEVALFLGRWKESKEKDLHNTSFHSFTIHTYSSRYYDLDERSKNYFNSMWLEFVKSSIKKILYYYSDLNCSEWIDPNLHMFNRSPLLDNFYGNVEALSNNLMKRLTFEAQSDIDPGIRNLIDAVFTKEKSDEKNNTEGKIVKDIKSNLDNESTKREIDVVMKELDSLVGIKEVKEDVRKVIDFLQLQKERKSHGLSTPEISRHAVFLGPPGTGKTTVARILGRVYKELGLLKKGHFVEADRSSLVAAYLGQTAIKVDEIIKKALDGVLFIDEAYSLVPMNAGYDDSFGKEAIDALLKRMEDYRDRIIVIIAGYEDKMAAFLNSNPGMKSRFNKTFYFKNYSLEELLEIINRMAVEKGFEIEDRAIEELKKHINDVLKKADKSFGNAREMRNILERIIEQQSSRLVRMKDSGLGRKDMVELTIYDVREAFSKNDATDEIESILSELNSVIGLKEVKQEVVNLINYLKIQQERAKHGLIQESVSRHAVFLGNPGTGKTMIARLLGKVYKSIGLLKSGHFIEADRASLVAGYLGQTAIKVDQVFEQAKDGVLFIDEAYSLKQRDDDSFGQEAIDTLLKRIEDYKDSIIVIFAGYRDEMKSFLSSNPGMKSRFNKYFEFEDYNPDEMLAIFLKMANDRGYVVEESVNNILLKTFEKLYTNRNKEFGNARTVRNILEKMIENQSNRLIHVTDVNKKDLTLLCNVDVPAI